MVACAGGAVPETVPEDAGLLVRPGDKEALREALASLLEDSDLRARLRAGARRARHTLPTWQQAAEQFCFALRDAAAT